MKIILIVTLLFLNQDKPAQQAGEMKDLKTCEIEAHKFMTHKFAKEVEEKIKFRSAACGFAYPGEGA